MSEIYCKMKDLVGEITTFTQSDGLKLSKKKINMERIIMFTKASGKSNVVCFKNMTEFIVNDKWFSERKKRLK